MNTMRRILCAIILVLTASLASLAAPEEPAWVKEAKRIHARFTGERGTVAQFGDSITVTKAFWTPLQYERRNASPAMEAAFKRVKERMKPQCWSDWKGPQFGSEGGQTIRWADAHLDEWLKKLNPEIAVIMFGSNDLHQLKLPEYRDKLRSVVNRCAERGTVPILTTLPPRHGFEKKAEQFAQAIREIATEKSLPLIDYYAEIVKRRPDDWDGALDKFKDYDVYEVPTLISRDGVHPSFAKRFQNDYSDEGLRSSGYTLRNYVTLLKVDEVMLVLN